MVAPDLGEDAGAGGHPAVHHAVEDGQQAVQREGLGAQEVVAGLDTLAVKLKNVKASVGPGGASVTFSFFLEKLVFLILPWCCWDKSRVRSASAPAPAFRSRAPSGRSVCPCARGCRRPGRRRSTGTWSNKAAPRECERTDLEDGQERALALALPASKAATGKRGRVRTSHRFALRLLHLLHLLPLEAGEGEGQRNAEKAADTAGGQRSGGPNLETSRR